MVLLTTMPQLLIKRCRHVERVHFEGTKSDYLISVTSVKVSVISLGATVRALPLLMLEDAKSAWANAADARLSVLRAVIVFL